MATEISPLKKKACQYCEGHEGTFAEVSAAAKQIAEAYGETVKVVRDDDQFRLDLPRKLAGKMWDDNNPDFYEDMDNHEIYYPPGDDSDERFAEEMMREENERLGEIYGSMGDYAESIARSEADGWFYPDDDIDEY